MLREEKGITLVGLVLIIVVLLILSGVAVSVFIQNSGSITPNPKNNKNATVSATNYYDAKEKLKLIFELYEEKYQTELAKGNIVDREDVFTANSIAKTLEDYRIKGNTVDSLENMDLSSGVTIYYGDQYTFIVRVSNTGIVTVLEK